jgi:hypothetical protein
MKHEKAIFLCAMLLFGAGASFAQEAISGTGGDASGTGGSSSYTVGQVSYVTYIGTNGSVAQGVQQAYEVSDVTGIEDIFGIDLGLNIYPNPTTDYLTLKVDLYEGNDLTYTLYDINGKILETKSIDESLTTIEMSTYSRASYFLKVVQNEQEVKTFKIIKNQ